MRTAMRYLLVGSLFLTLGVARLAAQETPPATPQAGSIESLQAKGVLSDEDTTALRTWIAQRFQTLTADNPAAANTAFAELRNSRIGTPAFIQAYTSACIQAAGSAYGNAERDAATRMLVLLDTFKELDAYPILVQALGDARVPVRAAAAIGLRNLQTKIAGASGNIFNEVIAALREAGKKEESAVVLKLIYEALNFERAPDARALADAVTNLLAARGDQYGGSEVKAVAADQPGLALAERLAAQSDDDGRRRLAIAAAKMLRYAVSYYTTELHKIDNKTSSPVQVQLRDRVELFIESAEKLLRTLLKPQDGPDVTQALQKSIQAEKPVNMKIAMNRWADLIQQTYQTDVHLEATEDEPGTEP